MRMTSAPSPELPERSPCPAYALPASAHGFALAGRLRTHQPLLHLALSDRELDMLTAQLAFFAPQAEVLRLSAWDTMPYDRNSPQPSIMASRMQTLARLLQPADKPRIILTTVNAALQKLPPPDMIQASVISLARGQKLPQNRLVQALLKQGYHRVGKAMETGEFAVRGGIIDLVPPGMGEGVRLDFFGDEIETIKRYDPMNQLSQGEIDRLDLSPVSEVVLSEENGERFRRRYRELFGAVTREDPLYEAISNQQPYPGMEHWLPLFYDQTYSLFDYAKDAQLTFGQDALVAAQERFETIRDYYDARLNANKSSKKNSFGAGAPYHPAPMEELFLTLAQWEKYTQSENALCFTRFTDAHSPLKPVLAFAQAQPDHTPFDQLKERAQAAAQRKQAVVLACFTEGSRERLFTMLSEREFHCLNIESASDIGGIKGKTIGLAVLPLENGFETETALFLSEQDVLGERIARARKKKKSAELFMMEAANFSEGELVVHKEHGIGRFEGLATITVQNAAHDCLKIIYDGGDKLFLPVENIELVSRYGADEEGVQLDKLGSASWQARKARLKERITIAAEALLKTAAERSLKRAAVMEAATGAYEEFCARFPYSETEDQQRAIDEVLSDLGDGKPMDRLICGDVGFGKTEVALRAAFAAASNPEHKMQVALICPTTLLARQHFRNFKDRFTGFSITVRQLSRMVPARAQKETREGLANGEVDIVIGTHALLSKQVAFKNLGLLIVDEEQHFGVGQKEKLKELKADVHVLTLSATPIPRTLQMALTGVRDLSLITTPPVDRLAIRSFVMPFDPVTLREALLREQHRGGKSFIVCPRIKDLADAKAKLAEIVPEIKIAQAHGQMTPGALDDIMNEFYDGKFDALLSTAIIESGLDIPTANTMVILHTHMFGLAQLYQLRGRVGRGKTRAYAYFMLPHQRELTKNATRRLEVMQTLDTLGAGFTLASHDMDIRGFGNLVGEEQSGHIREVGIELYQQMLEEAVAALKKNTARSESQDENKDWSPTISLGLSVLIPETYVADLDLRLGLYRRASMLASTEETNSFAAELTDRFGAMPEEVQNLITVLEMKLLCKQAGIERIDTGPKGAVLSFRENRFARPEKLLAYIDKHARHLKARPDQKLVYTQEWSDTTAKLAGVRKLLLDIGGLLASN